MLIPTIPAGSMGMNEIVAGQQRVWYVVWSLAALTFLIVAIAENRAVPPLT